VSTFPGSSPVAHCSPTGRPASGAMDPATYQHYRCARHGPRGVRHRAMRRVVDASALIDSVLPSDRQDAALTAMSAGELWAPPVIDMEVSSPIWRLERTAQISSAEAERAVAALWTVPLCRAQSVQISRFAEIAEISANLRCVLHGDGAITGCRADHRRRATVPRAVARRRDCSVAALRWPEPHFRLVELIAAGSSAIFLRCGLAYG